MAYKEQITVNDSTVRTQVSKFDPGKTYQRLIIQSSEGKDYESTNSAIIRMYDKGEELDLTVETVGNINRILTLKEVSMTKKFLKAGTATQTTGGTTNTDAEGELKFIKIKGTLFYTRLKEPANTGEFPSGKYEIQIGQLSDTIKTKLEDLGVQVKTKELQGNYVVAKSKQQPKVTLEGETFTEVPLIGNGSTAIVTTGLYNNRESNARIGNGGKKCLGIVQVDLIDFIPYEPTEAPLLTDDN